MADPQLLGDVRLAMFNSRASRTRVDQVLAGLAEFEAGRHHVAVPPLIHAIEGLLWDEIERAGVIERTEKGKWRDRRADGTPGRQIDGLESALKLARNELGESYERFVRAVVYGADGNAFRHGTADGAWHLRAALLVIALIGWLELDGQIASKEAVHHAFIRAQQRVSPPSD